MVTIGAIELKRSGFTLIELIVVLLIMGIVMAISSLSFSTWQKKNNMESQTRDLFTTLVEARNNAFMQKKPYSIALEPKSYVMYSYSSEADSTGRAVKNKNLVFGLTKGGSTPGISGTKILFDISGFTSDFQTIIVNPVENTSSINCLVISAARVNMGKINGTACEFK